MEFIYSNRFKKDYKKLPDNIMQYQYVYKDDMAISR
ncbi:MAG: hypothetical protein PWR06_2323 [Thermoanaerobacteraceae bacterium]|jgi:hypothetical protein|nr:hypothetical protein [Thermoanaerobacteraceae bacterium]